ncbi:UNVERIFIED_CONTAM: hypothetical protein PYX00_006754 [Menopon gallinae]|uniref:Mitochondrial ribosome-associated GTPase 2 n=1 Tax=Menopon gallinae TaxID=328185 RepID=A0AAW2HY00_9NEOP
MIILKNWSKVISLRRYLPFQSSVTFCSKEYEPVPLKSRKQKSTREQRPYWADSFSIQAIGGKGGDGCISFLQMFKNDKAGPDGGDGGHGGHVIFRASKFVTDLSHLSRTVKGDDGEKGYNKDCAGKNAKHHYIDVPVGTIVKNSEGVIVGDLNKENSMFIAARGGCGGRGNHFFVSDTNQAPQVAEVGAAGERIRYLLELRSVAHFGLVGLPNAGKSTFLQAISRARPEIADYEFTTLRPYIGVVPFSDYEQIFIADLPGLIEGSHRNKGLGIQFLKHVERCLGLLYMIDMSRENPSSQLDILKNELSSFSKELLSRPSVYIANKMDLPESQENLKAVEAETGLKFIGISAKTGKNVSALLKHIRKLYDDVFDPETE